MSLDVEVTSRAGRSGSPVSVVRLAGVLDRSTATSARKAFAILATQRPPTVIIDLERLRFLDSTGISALLSARIDFSKAGSNVFLTNPQRQIRRVLEIVHALPSSAVFATMDELDQYLADVQEKASDEEK